MRNTPRICADCWSREQKHGSESTVEPPQGIHNKIRADGCSEKSVMTPNLSNSASLSIFAFLIVLFLPPELSAQGLEYVKAHCTKHEYQIPMRDGVRLFTAVYVPRDTSQKHPFLMIRTQSGVLPYGPDQYKSDLGPSPLFGKEGYIFVYQDVRGRWMSEGPFVNVRPHNPAKKTPKDIDESTDTYDTIDWLLKNVPNHNGKVGLYGTSYRGFYVAAGMIDAHPALKAASPQAPIVDWFMGDDWHHNGAFFLAHAFYYLPTIGKPRAGPVQKPLFSPFEYGTPDGYDFFLRLGPLANVDARHFKGEVPFWNEMTRHGTYDAFWQSRNLRPHLRNIKPAVMTVGGWFDAENLFGALETYRRVEASSPKATNFLVMGPWVHGGRSSSSISRGRGRSSTPRRGSSRRGPTSGASTRPGRRGTRSRWRCTSMPGAGSPTSRRWTLRSLTLPARPSTSMSATRPGPSRTSTRSAPTCCPNT
jgi:predicted acyl esterase